MKDISFNKYTKTYLSQTFDGNVYIFNTCCLFCMHLLCLKRSKKLVLARRWDGLRQCKLGLGTQPPGSHCAKSTKTAHLKPTPIDPSREPVKTLIITSLVWFEGDVSLFIRKSGAGPNQPYSPLFLKIQKSLNIALKSNLPAYRTESSWEQSQTTEHKRLLISHLLVNAPPSSACALSLSLSFWPQIPWLWPRIHQKYNCPLPTFSPLCFNIKFQS